MLLERKDKRDPDAVCTITVVCFSVSAFPPPQKKNLTVIAARYVESNQTVKEEPFFFGTFSSGQNFLCGNFVVVDFLGKETRARHSQPEY